MRMALHDKKYNSNFPVQDCEVAYEIQKSDI